MMNSSISSSHLQQYHTAHIQQQVSSQYNPMQQHQPTMIGPGSSLPPPYSGPMQPGPPPHISMHAPNATVVSQQNCQIVPTNSIPPNAAAPIPMHMTSRPASMAFSQHPGSAAAMMKTQNPNNPNASKFMGGPGGMHATGTFGPNGQTNGQMVGSVPGAGNVPYTMQQQMVFNNNNNTVPYSTHAAAGMQRQIHPSQMMSANSMGTSGVQSLPNKPGSQMGATQMIIQEQMIAPSNMMPVNSSSVAQMRNGTTVFTAPQNSYINMQGQMMNQLPQQTQQTQSVNGFAVGPGLKPNMVPGGQHQMSMMIQQQQQPNPGMNPGSMNAVGGNNQMSQMGNPSSAAAMNRQQRLLALQHHQQQQMSIQKSQMMRQAVTPPASIEAASQHMGSSAFTFNQQQSHLGQSSMVGVPNRIMDTASGGIVNNQIPSPASNNSQITLTASTAMIGAPHSVPASQEVMPPSPQVTNNPTAINQFQQPAMFTNNSNNNQSLSASFAKRQSTTPPVANARATPSPISRKNSTSAALKRRSSSTSSFDQGADSMGATSTSANDLNEPTKVCRLTPTNVPVVPTNNLPGSTTSQQTHAHPQLKPNGSQTQTTRIQVANLPSSNTCHYSTLTLDAVHRKDSSCSMTTDTHSSPDSGLGDSGSESNGSCGSNSNSNNTHQQQLITASSPQCIVTDTGGGGKGNNINNTNTGGGAGCLSSEQMLENLIQELGIEKLDHLPELLDIFDNDSVFSNGTSSYDSNSAQQTRPRAAHVAAP